MQLPYSKLESLESAENLLMASRVNRVLQSHGIEAASLPFFLKQAPIPKLSSLASYFEVSLKWLAEESEGEHEEEVAVTEQFPIHTVDSLLSFFECVLSAKRQGWKPEILFVHADIIFVKLTKVTAFGIGFTTYKQWDLRGLAEHSESKLLLSYSLYFCAQSALPHRALVLSETAHQKIQKHLLLPIEALKEVLNMIASPSAPANMPVTPLLQRIRHWADKIRHTAVEPTYLLNHFNGVDI